MNAKFKNLSQAYGWLNSQINYEKNLGRIGYDGKTFRLERFAALLDALGRPQAGLRTVHIAGTRGKGSAALILERLLRAAGASTAVFTSPHLREYRERIRLRGEPLAPQLFCEVLAQVAAVQERTGCKDSNFATVFEDLTALFFLIAAREKIDWCIVETGLGGRLDATNVMEPGPVLLTRIGLEHTHLLGATLEAIASEKAAILKAGGWGVAAAQQGGAQAPALRVFEQRAAQTGAPLSLSEQLCPFQQVIPGPDGLRITLTWLVQPLELHWPVWGRFQAENLQNALAMMTALIQRGLVPALTADQVAGAIEPLCIPGRMQRVCTALQVFVDGGHCPAAAAALAACMADHFGDQPADLLVSMMEDKDHEGFFRELARWPGWRSVTCCDGVGVRGLGAHELAAVARRHFVKVTPCPKLEESLQIFAARSDKNARLVATGSLYAVARVQDWGEVYGGTVQTQTQT